MKSGDPSTASSSSSSASHSASNPLHKSFVTPKFYLSPFLEYSPFLPVSNGPPSSVAPPPPPPPFPRAPSTSHSGLQRAEAPTLVGVGGGTLDSSSAIVAAASTLNPAAANIGPPPPPHPLSTLASFTDHRLSPYFRPSTAWPGEKRKKDRTTVKNKKRNK